MRTYDVKLLDGKVACPYADGACVDVETCYRCRRLRAFHDEGSQTWVVCAGRPPRRARVLSRRRSTDATSV